MIGPKLRPLFARLLFDPAVQVLRRVPGLTPNVLTMLSLLSGVAVLPAFYWDHHATALVLILLTGYLDCLDGALARRTGVQSESGAVLDSIADRFVDTALLVGLFSVAPAERGWETLAMLSSLYINMSTYLILSVFTRTRNHKGYADLPSLIERPESFLLIFVMALVPGWFTALAWTYTVLTLFTAAQRLWAYHRQHRSAQLETGR